MREIIKVIQKHTKIHRTMEIILFSSLVYR